MNILWISNILFPDVCSVLGIPEPVTGGWMYSSAKQLVSETGIKLAVASIYVGKEFKKIVTNDITYFLLPAGNKVTYNNTLESYWKDIKISFQPEIVHIHGTEFPHGLAYINACGCEKVVVSIQGLVSVYERYYYSGLDIWQIIKNITIRDLLRNDNIFQQRKRFFKRGVLEKLYLKSGASIIGRTTWDKDHVIAVNPNAKYFFCNEALREGFYNHYWSYDYCEKYSIFLSQAAYPIKGLHQLLKSLPIVLKRFPDTKVYVSGTDPTLSKTIGQRLRMGGYGKIIKRLLKNYDLNEKVVFTGSLNENEMVHQYLKSNVFICPSSIENSPNSLGEAQLLGVPCVASYVGGVPDMIEYGKTGYLYRFEEFEMLANIICKIFDQSDYRELSKAESSAARVRHDTIVIKDTILEIYREIAKK